MALILEEELGFYFRKIARGKDKREKFLKQREFRLETLVKQNINMCAQLDAPSEPDYIIVSNDVWYQISRYIEPEDVQSFAMICKATASLARTKSFWKNLFKKYCLKFGTKIWILQLPAHLQLDSIGDYSTPLFRASVIEALFYCHMPLNSRLNSYTLDFLIGKDYISAWHKHWENCMWVMCYQFRQHGGQFPRRGASISENIELPMATDLDDWESLAVCDDNENIVHSKSEEYELASADKGSPYEGICLLIIFGNRFIPFPSQFTSSYGEQMFMRLSAVRQPLTSDLREYNLELDFLDTINKTTTTVKYPTVKHKVLPWWHPDFRKYIKYDNCDKFS